MSPSTEAGLPEKVAVVQKLAVLLPPVLILLKRIHHIQLTSRKTGDRRNQMDFVISPGSFIGLTRRATEQ